MKAFYICFLFPFLNNREAIRRSEKKALLLWVSDNVCSTLMDCELVEFKGKSKLDNKNGTQEDA